MTTIVGATEITKVWEMKAREAFVTMTGEIAPKPLADVVKGLEEHFAKMAPELLQQCDECFGWSPPSLTAECPFCGIGDAPASAKVANDASTVEIDATQIENLEEDASKTKKKRKAGTEAVAAEDRADRMTVRRAPAPMKPSAPAISILAGGSSLVSEKELDDEIAKFVEAGRVAAGSNYLMGISLVRLRDHLWQQRVEKGKPKYKSFEQFVSQELGISRAFATSLINVATNFTREQFDRLGMTPLKWIGAAPKEDRPMLLAMAEAGATSRTIQEEVGRIRREKGVTYMEGASTTARNAAHAENSSVRPAPTPAAATAAAKARRKPTPAITIALKSEQMTVKALARVKRGEEDRPARTLEDQPFCAIECMNGTKLFIALKTRPTGELEFKVTAKRDEE